MSVKIAGLVLKNEFSAGNLTKKHELDAGLDIKAAHDVCVWQGERAVISTGLHLAIPAGFVGLLCSRSGLSVNHGIEVGAGVIDASYRGEIKVVLYNHGLRKYEVKAGDKIAQLLTVPVNLNHYGEVDELPATDRGANGFGSTGK